MPQFLKMQNINAFLNACVSPCGLKQSDLFTAEQLYYASEFFLVCAVDMSSHCLNALRSFKPSRRCPRRSLRAWLASDSSQRAAKHQSLTMTTKTRTRTSRISSDRPQGALCAVLACGSHALQSG